MTDHSLLPFDLPAVRRKKVTAAFDGGLISSDGGLVLPREAERRLGLAEMPRFRMLAIACGCEDADDCDALRGDLLFKLAVGRPLESGHDLCSQPTISRVENMASRITGFRFRALSPIFDTAPFSLAGQPADDGRLASLWVADPAGGLAMDGAVDLD